MTNGKCSMTKPARFLCFEFGPLNLFVSCLLFLGYSVLGCILFFGHSAFCQTTSTADPAAKIVSDLKSFREFSSVLYVAAHPDDENTQLIAYLARGRHSRTAYLSVTRGDGGQNVLGPEFGEELGVIRTQELLAARRIDGGRQFFTTALDFGFSKTADETLKIWDRKQVVGDIVRVIRTFRPDVIITRFNPNTGGTHGHHTASAILALEAFKVAGEPNYYPKQLVLPSLLRPFQPKRILMNGRGEGGISLDISGTDEVTGKSYLELAGRSRSMHKSQGFGNFGGGGNRQGRAESFTLLAGEPATKSIFDGIDTTWNRIPGEGGVDTMCGDLIAHFDAANLDANVPAILAIRKRMEDLVDDPVAQEKRGLLDHILAECLGLTVQTTTGRAEVVPGESLLLHSTSTAKTALPLRWIGTSYPAADAKIDQPIEMKSSQSAARDSTQALPAKTPISQPYWLREEPTAGMFRVNEPSLIGQPENPPAFPIRQTFEISGQTFTLEDEPISGDEHRRLEVIAPVALSFTSPVALCSPGGSRPLPILITAARDNISGKVRIEASPGWAISPQSQDIHLAKAGASTPFTFTLTAPAGPGTTTLAAIADIDGASYSYERIEIRYPHIPPILLQPPAHLKATALDLAIRGKNIGYLPGAGDSVADCMQQMGYAVTTLKADDLTPDTLKQFDAIVIGVRAFNVRSDLQPHMKDLFSWVESGGNLIVQYNRPGGFKTTPLAPYNLQISGDRVTDETAPVKFLAPDHPVLNTPNKITSADFNGWVQERGIYFPSEWDSSHFTPILSMNDPGEAPLTSSLLIANYGKGHYIYTSLVFFRELPAGVPGAYRLLANMIALGK
jgi:LmbE family N-acetylglucosaminyl deacetylase